MNGFVLDSYALTDPLQPKNEEESAQANNEILLHDLSVAQKNIKSLQERLSGQSLSSDEQMSSRQVIGNYV